MITFFTTAKAFVGLFEVIQRNAISSWQRLGADCEVILLGDDAGGADVARELGLNHVPEVARNEYGSPLVSDMFAIAHARARHGLLCYVNADIILMQDFWRAAHVARDLQRPFLMCGRRSRLDVTNPLAFEPGWEDRLRRAVSERGQLDEPQLVDYFLFTRGVFGEIPPFAIGRRRWDRWLQYRARSTTGLFIDATDMVTAVHQNHNYGTTGYVGHKRGPETRRNIELAGDDWCDLRGATHKLTPAGVTRVFDAMRLGWRLRSIPRAFARRLKRYQPVLPKRFGGHKRFKAASKRLRAAVARIADPEYAPKKIAFVGLGKIGFPLAVRLAHKGYTVAGVDLDSGKLRTIARGKALVQEKRVKLLPWGCRQRLTVQSEFAGAVRNSDVTILALPTQRPDDQTFIPEDLRNACEGIARVLADLRRYHLVVIVSTVLPGWMDNIIRPALEQTGKKVGRDIGLCYCPQLVAMGDTVKGYLAPERSVIGESDPIAGKQLLKIFRRVWERPVPVVRTNFLNAELASPPTYNLARSMNVLFLIARDIYFRAVDPVIREMHARGHHVSVLHGGIAKKKESTVNSSRAMEKWEEQSGIPVAFRGVPPEKWHDVMVAGRRLANYALYLRGEHLSGFRGEAIRAKLPWWQDRLLRSAPIRRMLASRWALAAWRSIEAASAPSPAVLAQLDKYRPDVLMVSPAVWHKDPTEADYLHAARARGIPTAGFVASWDNLTSKGTIPVVPDVLMVWNRALAEEAVALHDIPPRAIRLVGAPYLDHFFTLRPTETREEVCRRVGFPPDKPYVVYFCTSATLIASEKDIVLGLADALERRGIGQRMTLMVRPHPFNAFYWHDCQDPRIVIFPRGGEWADYKEAWQEYYNLLASASAVIALNTTAFLEALVLDRPCMTLLDPAYHMAQTATGHFRHLVAGEFMEPAANVEELAHNVGRCLDGADPRAERRRAFLEFFVRPSGLEMPAATVVADILENLARPAAVESSCPQIAGLGRLPDPMAGARRPFVSERPVALLRPLVHRVQTLVELQSEWAERARQSTRQKEKHRNRKRSKQAKRAVKRARTAVGRTYEMARWLPSVPHRVHESGANALARTRKQLRKKAHRSRKSVIRSADVALRRAYQIGRQLRSAPHRARESGAKALAETRRQVRKQVRIGRKSAVRGARLAIDRAYKMGRRLRAAPRQVVGRALLTSRHLQKDVRWFVLKTLPRRARGATHVIREAATTLYRRSRNVKVRFKRLRNPPRAERTWKRLSPGPAAPAPHEPSAAESTSAVPPMTPLKPDSSLVIITVGASAENSAPQPPPAVVAEAPYGTSYETADPPDR